MDRVRHLEQEILKHKELYYSGKAEISDEAYDKLEEELRSLAPNSYALSIVGSTVKSTDKVTHAKKMLSLNKTYKLEELVSWKGEHDLLSTFKIDGSSCSLIYEDGKLFVAKTRGDGSHGENITPKALWIDLIPKDILEKTNLEVRGEIYCTESDFAHLSEKMIELGLERPTSLRNIVAGLLGRKDHIQLAKYLEFQAFELIGDLGLKTEVDKIKLLKKLGFQVPEYNLNKNKKDIEKVLEDAKEFIADGDYLIDGMVFTINDITQHAEMGYTAHHPRYKMAFKFPGETKVTSIESIGWQVSRNGNCTPVANVAPVELSGAMIGRVTLHNYGIVRDFNLKAGDEIEIIRSGEVIPKFLSVKKDSGNPFEKPSHCPSCGTELNEVDIRLICPNKLACPSQVKETILNFIQKIGIDDLSSKRLDEMLEKGLVKSIPDLYKLQEDDFFKLDKVKEKLANKLYTSIQKSKEVDLITFLSSLGLTGGAYNKCEKIVQNGFDTLEKVRALSVETLSSLESFAVKSSTDFLLSLNEKSEIIDQLFANGLKIKKAEVSSGEGNLAGKAFCITGTLTKKRSDIAKMIKNAGGNVVSSVSKNTDYLVTNDTESSSSKFKKAKELGTPILNETKLEELINGTSENSF